MSLLQTPIDPSKVPLKPLGSCVFHCILVQWPCIFKAAELLQGALFDTTLTFYPLVQFSCSCLHLKATDVTRLLHFLEADTSPQHFSSFLEPP